MRSKIAKAAIAGVFAFVVPMAGVVAPPQPGESTIFHAGTRLVEVEVVVRGHQVIPPGMRETLKALFDSGPPFGPPGALIRGLTRDDFALFDNGKPQQISLFRAGPSSEINALPVPPGAVSNRQDKRGEALNGATVVLADFLNTPFDLNDYGRMGLTGVLRSLSESDTRVAVYTLGEKLHILQDFTDDPHKLMADFAEMDQPHGHASPALASAFEDRGAILVTGLASRNARPITDAAVKLIVQHLGGVPGRKNLIWMRMPPSGCVVARTIGLGRGAPPELPPWASKQVLDLLLQSNIALYPVVTRSVGPCDILMIEHDAEDLAAAYGGRAFFDSLDLPAAVRAAEEDTQGSYVLGYYPAQEMLDGKYHNLTVKLINPKLAKDYEIQSRPGYSATKVAAAPAPPSLPDLFSSPLQAANIGLVGRATRDAQNPDLYNVRLTVDLRDIHLDHKDGHFTGAFAVVQQNPSAFLSVKTRTITLDLPEAELAGALENGGTFLLPGVEAQEGEIRVVVRDQATGVSGSLRIPVEGPAK